MKIINAWIRYQDELVSRIVNYTEKMLLKVVLEAHSNMLNNDGLVTWPRNQIDSLYELMEMEVNCEGLKITMLCTGLRKTMLRKTAID